MDLWFTENLEIVKGLRAQVQIAQTLHTERSDFQRLDVVETVTCGRMLILDGVIMTTEFDEFAYHEMIAHVPLFAHPAPRTVLVVGGGDGGTVREVLKHPSVEEVHLVEIDRKVVEVCERFLPSIAGAVRNPKVKHHYTDGAKWVKDHRNTYDVILVDSSDPIGPAAVLFQEQFYADCRDALKDGGILVNQAENFFLHGEIIAGLMNFGRKLFTNPRYYITQVPTYPAGGIGFTFFSKGPGPFENFEAKVSRPEFAWISTLKYWTPEIQRGAFCLPALIARKIGL